MFPDVVTERMYYIWISGETFGKENWTVSHMLKEYLISSLCWDWIDRFNRKDNVREVFGLGQTTIMVREN